MPTYSQEALDVRRQIINDPDFDKLPAAAKREVLQRWRAKYEQRPQRVDMAAEPTTIGVGSQRQPNVRQPLRPAVQPVPQPAGPPVPPAYQPGPLANALLTGYANTAAAKASEAAGRPVLPEGLTRPVEGAGMQALSILPPLAEGLAAAVGTSLIPGVGWTAGPALAGAATGAAQDAAAGLAPEQMRLNALGNAVAGAMPAPMARALPGNQISTALVRNLAQGEIPVTANEAITGRQFGAMDVIPGALLGAAIDVGMGQSAAPRIRQAAGHAAERLQQPIPLGDLDAQRGSFNPQRREGEVGGGGPAGPVPPVADPPTPPRISPAADRAWDAAGQPISPADPAGGGQPPVPPRPPAADPAPTPDPVPPPQPGQYDPAPPTPAMERVFGPDVDNLRGEARRAARDLGDQYDPGPARPPAAPEQINAVNPGDYFLERKFKAVSDEAQQNLRRLVQESIAETGGDPKRVIGFEALRRDAASVAPEMVDHLKPLKDHETLPAHVHYAAKNYLNDLNAEAVKLRTQAAEMERSMAPREEISQLVQRAERLERDAKGIFDVLYQARSQDGRNLGYHRMMVNQTMDTSYWQSRAQRIAGGPLADDKWKELGEILHRGQQAEAAGNQTELNKARKDLALALAKLEKSSLLDTIAATVKAGLLTGPKTHMRNLVGNALFQVTEEVARLPAALVDMALSLSTGRRTVSAPDPAAVIRASTKGAAKGWREFKEIMRTGTTDEALARFDLPRELNSGHKWLDTYVNGVFRLLNAEDRIFKQIAIRRSLEEQALLVARAEAKAARAAGQPFDVKARRAELVERPTDAMMAQAIGDAELLTFNNENLIATAYSRGRQALRGNPAGEALNFAADMTTPFVKTPTNILGRILDYGGVGGVNRGGVGIARRVKGRAEGEGIAKALFKKLSPEEQRGVSQAIGRGSVGIGLILLGYYLAKHGLMTGLTAEDEGGIRGTNQIAGRQEGAIRIGGRWLQLGGLPPFGPLLVIGATMYQEGARDYRNPAKAAGRVAAAATQAMLDQPMLQGVENVQDVFKDPIGQGGRLAASYAGMAVPTLVADVASQFDDRTRRRSDPNADPLTNAATGIASRVPGLRNLLPEQTDPFGRPMPQSEVPALDMFNSRRAREADDPIAGELTRLRVEVMRPRDVQDLRDPQTGERIPTRLTPEQQNELRRAFGRLAVPILHELIHSPDYQQWTDEERKEALERVISRTRAAASRQIRSQLTPTP